jgi:hypothetical protein
VLAQFRWEITVTVFSPIAAISTEYVNAEWTSELAGEQIDPTGQTQGQSALNVQFAFPLTSANPRMPAEPVTWYPAVWLQGSIAAGYIAQCLVGPGSGGGPTLTAGQKYDVWSQILGSPEQPARFVGTLPAY